MKDLITNKISYVVLFVTSMSILIGCQIKHTENNKLNLIDVNPNNKSTHSVNSCFKNFEYIPLETNDNCLISEIKKGISTNEFLYILDKNQKQVLKFDFNGKFIFKIKEIGKGPGEYLSVDDINIDDLFLYVLARDSKKLIKYDLNGNFISELNLDGFYSRFSICNNKCYLYRNFSENKSLCNICIVDLDNGKEINNLHKFSKKQIGQGYSTSAFSRCNDSIYAFFPNDYRIYSLRNNDLRSIYKINVPEKYSLPADSPYMSYEELENIEANQGIVQGINNMLIYDSFVFFNYVYKMRTYSIIYDKQTKTTYDGILGFNAQIPLLSAQNIIGKIDVNKIVFYVNPTVVFAYLKYASSEAVDISNYDFVKKITVNSNPILLITELND